MTIELILFPILTSDALDLGVSGEVWRTATVLHVALYLAIGIDTTSVSQLARIRTFAVGTDIGQTAFVVGSAGSCRKKSKSIFQHRTSAK